VSTTAFTLVDRPRHCAPSTLHRRASTRNDIFHTKLQYRAHDEEDDELSTHKLRTRASPVFNKAAANQSTSDNAQKIGGINTNLVLSFILNQAVILAFASGLIAAYIFLSGNQDFVSEGILNWSGFTDAPSASLDFSLSPIRFAQGALGAVPMILLSNKIDKSDNRKYAMANFSTVFMVMTLFGRRQSHLESDEKNLKMDMLEPITKTVDVALVAAGLSALTGFCEEVIFRGFLPHVLKSKVCFGNTALACVGQAGLFGLGHTSPRTSLKDNQTLLNIQFLNGLWVGLLYMMVGGDVVPCMVAHAVYDFQVLFFTWLAVNDQMEYCYQKSLEPDPKDCQKEIAAMKRQMPEHVYEMCKRVFYIFDEDKNGHISKSEVQRGINYLEAEGLLVAPSQKTVSSVFDSCIEMRKNNNIVVDVETQDQLRMSDFVRLFLTLKTVSETVTAPARNKQNTNTIGYA
jgi:membrane protease YdiL (CAAX protease family)